MGLAERKAVQVVKDGDYKTFQNEINKICGFDVKMNFDWSLIENHSDCKSIMDNHRYKSFMFDRILGALTKITADDMGKGAIKESLKEIQMIPEAGAATFAAGVLTVRNDLTGNCAYSADQIQTVLEKNL